MKTRLEINITDGDIKRGTKMDSDSCPIALATKRAFKYNKMTTPHVLGSLMKFYANKRRQVVFLPIKAKNFISKFDNGEKVKPFKFVIRYGK